MGSRNCWANQKWGSPGPFSQRDREDRNLFCVFLGAFCWASRTSRPIYTYIVHIHIHSKFVCSCACVPCVAARKSLLLTFYLVYVFYGLVHKTHSHTSTHTPRSGAHTHNPFPWNDSLFCRHFCVPPYLWEPAFVCVCVWEEGAGVAWWGGTARCLWLSSLSLLCCSYPRLLPQALSHFLCVCFHLYFIWKLYNKFAYTHMYKHLCMCMCVRQIYANFKCFLFVMNLTSM